MEIRIIEAWCVLRLSLIFSFLPSQFSVSAVDELYRQIAGDSSRRFVTGIFFPPGPMRSIISWSFNMTHYTLGRAHPAWVAASTFVRWYIFILSRAWLAFLLFYRGEFTGAFFFLPIKAIRHYMILSLATRYELFWHFLFVLSRLPGNFESCRLCFRFADFCGFLLFPCVRAIFFCATFKYLFAEVHFLF